MVLGTAMVEVDSRLRLPVPDVGIVSTDVGIVSTDVGIVSTDVGFVSTDVVSSTLSSPDIDRDDPIGDSVEAPTVDSKELVGEVMVG